VRYKWRALGEIDDRPATSKFVKQSNDEEDNPLYSSLPIDLHLNSMPGEETQSSAPSHHHPPVSPPPSPLIPLLPLQALTNPPVPFAQPPSIPTWSHQPGTFAQPPPSKTLDHEAVFRIILISIIVILLLICLFFH
jgi:hypothetical protein